MPFRSMQVPTACVLGFVFKLGVQGLYGGKCRSCEDRRARSGRGLGDEEVPLPLRALNLPD